MRGKAKNLKIIVKNTSRKESHLNILVMTVPKGFYSEVAHHNQENYY